MPAKSYSTYSTEDNNKHRIIHKNDMIESDNDVQNLFISTLNLYSCISGDKVKYKITPFIK